MREQQGLFGGARMQMDETIRLTIEIARKQQRGKR